MTKMTKKTKNAVAAASKMFEDDAGMGVHDLGTEDLAIPFLKILQKMSPELDDNEGARAGDIYNTVTKELVEGKQGVRVVNCAYQLNYIEWLPRGSGNGAPIHVYTATDEIPETQRGDDSKDYIVDGSGRYLERTAQHYVLIISDEGITQQALLSMKSTQFKKSKAWNSAMKAIKMKNTRGGFFTPPRFSHTWELKTTTEENKNGSWHGWEIKKEGPIEDVDLYQEARNFAHSIGAGEVKVQHKQEDDRPSDEVPF
jgi:hypothetical protein